jgi:hypothetical protein
VSTDKSAPFAVLAVSFADALVAGDFVKAHSMLGSALGAANHPDHLRQTFKAMIDYGDGPVTDVQLMETLEQWPSRQPQDSGWAYVAIGGDGYSEAVTVVVTQEDGTSVIRDIEWGRP